MDIIEMTRELGKALQQDDRYIAYNLAKQVNDEDTELQADIKKFEELRIEITTEMTKSDKDGDKLQQLDAQVKEVYEKVMANKNMQVFMAAQTALEALVNKIESALQAAVINGDGSSKAEGIAHTHSTADGTFTKAGITKADLLKIMGKLPGKYQRDAVWIMPSAVFYEAMGIANIQNFVNVGDDLKKVICGKPVITDDNCVISSTDTILYGAAKAYHLNIGNAIEVSRTADRYFEYDNIGFKAVTYADGKLDNSEAFVKYTRATA